MFGSPITGSSELTVLVNSAKNSPCLGWQVDCSFCPAVLYNTWYLLVYSAAALFFSTLSLTKVKHDLMRFSVCLCWTTRDMKLIRLLSWPALMQPCGWRDAQRRAEKEYCSSSRWNMASNSLSDDKVKSMLHFPHCHLCDLLLSPLGATVILSSAENLLKKYLTSLSSHRIMTLLSLTLT